MIRLKRIGIFVFSVVALIWSGAAVEGAVVFTPAVASFSGTNNGSNPGGDLVLGRDGLLYGTTIQGGTDNYGNVFRVETDWRISSLFSFSSNNGANPRSGLLQSLSGPVEFYGTTPSGGANNLGTIFKVLPDGTHTTLVSFSGPDGAIAQAPLIWGSGGNLLGTTYYGGTNDWPNGYGTVFEATTSGSLTTRLSFYNAIGADPFGPLTHASDGNYYGTTDLGGSGGFGTVFRLTSGGVFTSLASFQGTNGALPRGRLTEGPDGHLYGTTFQGGISNQGTVFRITTSGTLTTLVSFVGTNGSVPFAGLLSGADGRLYGTTMNGGASGLGTVFQVTTDGVLTTLASFGETGGKYPLAGLTRGADGSYYGTTAEGGDEGHGTVFRLTVSSPAPPTILSVRENAGKFEATYTATVGESYQVQFKTDLSQTGWTNLGSSVVATNGVMGFADPIGSPPHKFYRVGLVQ